MFCTTATNHHPPPLDHVVINYRQEMEHLHSPYSPHCNLRQQPPPLPHFPNTTFGSNHHHLRKTTIHFIFSGA
ncbi:hypothetical protein Hanom_Chr01g00006251 [Helianthus anomalus]